MFGGVFNPCTMLRDLWHVQLQQRVRGVGVARVQLGQQLDACVEIVQFAVAPLCLSAPMFGLSWSCGSFQLPPVRAEDT